MTEMKHQKKFLLVFLILTIFGVNSQPTCSTTSNRIDCGYVGITESEVWLYITFHNFSKY